MTKNENIAPVIYDRKENCCGCSACYSVCPADAIKMTKDEEGFLYPLIDKNICINCNKCINICKFKNHQSNKGYCNTVNFDKTLIPQVYAVQHKNHNIRMNSRSGGFFTAISDKFIGNGGVIYGCVLDDKFDAVHIRATTAEERNKMRGSKYIQSDTTGIFSCVLQDLKKDIPVLFTGTSCQIAGLKGFLEKEYDNLICVDIVCHGVPSPKVWQSYLNWQEKNNNAKCIAVDFRNKVDYGWKAHIETLTMKNADNETLRVNSEIFKSLFYGHNILRPSCYECPYKSTIHPGDITIADYWGIDKAAPEFNDDKGVSLVLINNKKGEDFFNSICGDTKYKSCKLEDSLQPPLIKPFPKPLERDYFWKDFNSKPFDFIVNKYAHKNKQYKFLIYYLKIKRLIKNI